MKKLLLTLSLFAASALSLMANNTENWYFNVSAGYSSSTYHLDGNEIDMIYPSISGIDSTHIPYAIDLGLYGIATRSTLFGVTYNLTNDYQKLEAQMSDEYIEVDFGSSLLAFSMMHFLSGEAGSGLFLRLDAGAARFHSSTTEYYAGQTTEASDSSDWGVGLLAGAGLALDFGGTSVLVSANYSLRTVTEYESEFQGNTFSLTAGLMF